MGFSLFYVSSPSRGESKPSPGGPFHAPRSLNCEPSPVMSPWTPRVDAWGTVMRSRRAGWRTVEQVTRREYRNLLFFNIPMTTTTT